MTLEVPVETLNEAIAAVRAGADRLELCASLDVGGLTPSLDTLVEFAAGAPAPFVVMIRPRSGDFVYSDDEAAAMKRSIAEVIAHGAEGIVFGALSRDAAIDLALCQRFIEAAGPGYSVFHRAFDEVFDSHLALEQLIDLGFTRILTSGGCTSVADTGSAERIAGLIACAADRIEILPGGGIRPGNAASLIQTSRCSSIHSSCRRPDNGQLRFDPKIAAELRRIIDHPS